MTWHNITFTRAKAVFIVACSRILTAAPHSGRGQNRTRRVTLPPEHPLNQHDLPTYCQKQCKREAQNTSDNWGESMWWGGGRYADVCGRKGLVQMDCSVSVANIRHVRKQISNWGPKQTVGCMQHVAVVQYKPAWAEPREYIIFLLLALISVNPRAWCGQKD
jgi:hypothetical protein